MSEFELEREVVSDRAPASAESALVHRPEHTFEDALELAHTQLTVYKRPPDEAALVMGNDYGYDLAMAKRAVSAVLEANAKAERRWRWQAVGLTGAVIGATALWHFAFGAEAGAYLVAAAAILGGNAWMLWLRYETGRI